ncbi:hypothetical protein M595_5121 [Lyngbya aestuarii BL J]|uniref:Uncharacterized protein n=1 Tax=Lyngbya aestuarii BL J TaxID=1348334 RepID=U7QER9_9CYAN|nr:hypothetical protein [Lyngbya aestuarii]ERT04931.1 hypothetical protein M595_5121 [Lyngbya aestuarii BL J]
MATELISFRLSGDDLEWIKSQCLPEESLNLAAKRLLLLALNSGVNTVDTSVDTPKNEHQLNELESRLNERLTEIEQRLESFVQTNDCDASVDTPVDRCIHLEKWLSDTLPRLNHSPGYKDKSARSLIKSIQDLGNS